MSKEHGADERGLTLSAALADQLLAHARADAPNEACGILAGSLAEARATEYHPARNADASPYVYTVHPDDLVRIVLGIDDAGQDLVGIFHSHTRTPAVPSPTDRRQAMYPGAIHILATLMDAEAVPMQALRAWRIGDGEATEVALRID
ncbi:MAG: Mov34/MPN/PAD-1 family protein [Candidatus Limnocylindria bacterium]